MNNILKIVYTPTNDSYRLAIVSMYSLLKNNDKNIVDFYIVIDNNFDKNNCKDFFQLKQFKNCRNIQFVNTLFEFDNYFRSKVYVTERMRIYQLSKIIHEDRVLIIDDLENNKSILFIDFVIL